jgi:hypothetical protein
LSEVSKDGYKNIMYAEIPEGFDQTRQYVVQTVPVDKGEYIFVGNQVLELPEEVFTDNEFSPFE